MSALDVVGVDGWTCQKTHKTFHKSFNSNVKFNNSCKVSIFANKLLEAGKVVRMNPQEEID